jgi:hypothetical protein
LTDIRTAGRLGNSWNNAAVESVFPSLNTERIA